MATIAASFEKAKTWEKKWQGNCAGGSCKSNWKSQTHGLEYYSLSSEGLRAKRTKWRLFDVFQLTLVTSEERGKPECPEKNLLVQGERSRHCTNPAPPLKLSLHVVWTALPLVFLAVLIWLFILLILLSCLAKGLNIKQLHSHSLMDTLCFCMSHRKKHYNSQVWLQ